MKILLSSSLPLALLLSVLSTPLRAGTISGKLSPNDLNTMTEILGEAACTRVMRAAEAYETWPGLKIGLEIALIPTRDINLLGDGSGTLPGLNMTPRFYIAKGLFFNTELILNFFPSSLTNSLSTTGLIVKWTFYSEQDRWLNAAGFVGLTSINGFQGSFQGSDTEIGMLASKDFVRVKPYGGLGILLASGNVNPAYAATPVADGHHTTLHAFFGAEWELPVNLTAQIDFMNLAMKASLFIGKHF